LTARGDWADGDAFVQQGIPRKEGVVSDADALNLRKDGVASDALRTTDS
jgi:hypothetical protein